jgi:RNA polymerase sigma-70 factor (ECF subfamily)
MAENYSATDWDRILTLYDLLREIQPTPVVLINRAIAVSHVHGAAAALAALRAVPLNEQAERYRFLPAAEGEFQRQLGQTEEAVMLFRRALAFAQSEPERRFLERKLETLLTAAGG